MDLMEPIKLRILTMKDLDAVTEIDHSLLGSKRRDTGKRGSRAQRPLASPHLQLKLAEK
jgi:hypothetical protein